MKGAWVEVWHPESPGIRVRVWRPWWARKRKPFATANELRKSWTHFIGEWFPRGGVINNIDPQEDQP